MTALDSLRGLAVLMMTLSGIIPYDKPLPAWMYHAQEPPPTHDFNDRLAGLTWVDLVFPMFLFCMGAAIPIALTRKLEGGVSRFKIVGSVLIRGALLAWYGVYLQHIRPTTLNPTPTAHTWWTALLGLLLLFLMYTRLPDRVSKSVRYLITGVGFAGAILLMWSLRYPKSGYSHYFTTSRNDIIIMVLANMAVFGTLIWIATRKNQLARLSILPLYLALRLSATQPGWVKIVWKYTPTFGDDTPLAFLFNWDWLKYLFIVIPGTIAGDQILKWMKAEKLDATGDAPKPKGKHANKWILLIFLCFGLIATLLTGLEGRHLWQTTLVGLGMSGIIYWLTLVKKKSDAEPGAMTSDSEPPTKEALHTFAKWAGYWLLLGLLFEPFEGGIKKDHSTISYYFVTSAVALYALSAFIVLHQLFKMERMTKLLTAVGQNPMIGYCAMGNLIQPILALTTLDVVFARWTPDPWAGVLIALCETIAMALFVGFCTRIKLFWRA